jgi:short-subunit dehydrogenase
MKALITGASSGLGSDFARILSSQGYDLILVARRKDKLKQLKEELSTNVDIICTDLSSSFNCSRLYNKLKNDDIDVIINNAGFGVFGSFETIKLEKELDLIDINIKAVHILTKLFLTDFKKKDKGYILNVASSAAFQPGPLMATYYASKSYVYNLTCALYEELRRDDSDVKVSVLCPGPVNTEFNAVAGVEFGMKSLESYDVAKYAIDKMFKNKLVIVPGFQIKVAKFLGRFLPIKLLLKITYNIQKKKVK